MANDVYTLFDNSKSDKEYRLEHDQLQAIFKLNKVVGRDVLRPELAGSGAWRLHTGPCVGTLRVRDLSIQILPKIHRHDGDENEEQAKSATRSLLYMLKYAPNMDIHEYEIAPLLSQKRDWFEILTYLFASHLLTELQRGAVKGYNLVKDDIPFLKGKWLIQRQIRFPMRRYIFSVAFDEFTEDNPLNRVFRYVANRLWPLTVDLENKRLLGDLYQMMDGVTLLPKVTSKDVDKVSVSRLYPQYEPILNLARLFLEDGTLQIAAGRLNSFAFILDMNQLFESFVIGFIKKHRQEILPLQLKECDLQAQSRGTTFHLARLSDKPVFQVKPDLVFKKTSGDFPIILDTKYKRLSIEKDKLDIDHNDFNQMVVYAFRYPGCKRVILVYPWGEKGERPPKVEFKLENATIVVEAATVDFRMDLSKPEDRKHLKEELKDILEVKQK